MSLFHEELQPLKTALAFGDKEQALREEITILRSLLDEALSPDLNPDPPTLRECVDILDMTLGNR